VLVVLIESSYFQKGLERTESNPTANITKKGYLRLHNARTLKEKRVFARTESTEELQRIGAVVCAEFGFDRCVHVEPRLAGERMRAQYADNEREEYVRYVNEQSISGIECSGAEATVKDCRASNDAPYDAQLYELEIECLCEYSIFSLFSIV
jgi:hypothetical protein